MEEDNRPILPRRWQFELRTLLGLAVVVAAVFGTLRWLGFTPQQVGLVVLILVGSVAAAVGLMWALAASIPKK